MQKEKCHILFLMKVISILKTKLQNIYTLHFTETLEIRFELTLDLKN